MNLFTETEIIIMISVVGFLLFVVILLSISEFFSNRKEKKNRSIIETEDNKVVGETLSNQKIEEATSLNLISELKEEKNKEIEEVREESKNMIEPLILDVEPDIEVIKIEPEEEKKLDAHEKLEVELLKLEDELEHAKSLEDTITNLEINEEENAIISYQELLSNTNDLDMVSEDDGDEPITISEVFQLFNEKSKATKEIEEPLLNQFEEDTLETEEKVPYLSLMDEIETESLSEIQLENTANLEKLEKEIRKTNEFLNILNELKKNLD